MRQEIIKKIIDIMLLAEYSDYGIRISHDDYDIGAELAASKHCDDYDDYGIQPGTSTVGIVDRGFTPCDADDIRDAAAKALDIADNYNGNYIMLVGGSQTSCDYDLDVGEMRIANAIVLAKWELEG
jgi:hypothetical protein